MDGGAPPPELLWRKNLALVVYLARSPTRSRTRDHLIGILWPEKEQSAARHSLREAVRVLRKVIGDGMVVEGDQVRLLPECLELDTDQLEQARDARDWKTAAGLVAGDFLEGFSVPESSAFEDWLASERLFWQRRAVDVLVQRAEALIAAGDPMQAGDAAHRALALAPTSEGAVRAAMRAAALGADQAGALGTFDRFAAALRETGAQPSGSLQQLADRIRRERSWKLPVSVQGSPDRAGGRRLPLSGRERELDQLVALLARVERDGTAAVAVIEGDAGLGKTRLAEELLARARLDGFAVVAMRAVPGDEDQAGNGLAALGRGGLLDLSGVAAAPAGALAGFATQQVEWAERFPAARSTPPLLLPAAITELLRAATAEQPVVVLMDDAQWIDRQSLQAVQAGLRDLAGAPLLWVLTVAPYPARDELDDLRARIGRDLPGVSLRLEPLARDSLVAMTRASFPRYSDEEVDRLSRRLLRDSAGFPLLAVELLSAIALGLELDDRAGAWPRPLATLEQTLPGDLPDALVAAIRIGFRRLSKDAQAVLAAAAVLGPRVSKDRLARVTGMAAPALHAATDELEWLRWLLSDGRGFSFVAGIIREVIDRDMVTAGQRERIREATS